MDTYELMDVYDVTLHGDWVRADTERYVVESWTKRVRRELLNPYQANPPSRFSAPDTRARKLATLRRAESFVVQTRHTHSPGFWVDVTLKVTAKGKAPARAKYQSPTRSGRVKVTVPVYASSEKQAIKRAKAYTNAVLACQSWCRAPRIKWLEG